MKTINRLLTTLTSAGGVLRVTVILASGVVLTLLVILFSYGLPRLAQTVLPPNSGVLAITDPAGWLPGVALGVLSAVVFGSALLAKKRGGKVLFIALSILGFACIGAFFIAAILVSPVSDTGTGEAGTLTAFRDIPNGLPVAIFAVVIFIILLALFSPDNGFARGAQFLFLLLIFAALPIAWVFRPQPEVFVSFATPMIQASEDSGEIMVRVKVTGDRDVPVNLCAETAFIAAPLLDSADSTDFLRFNRCPFAIFPNTKEIELPVTLIDDDIIEAPEIFAITLSSDNPFVSFGDSQTVEVIILDNDDLILEFTATEFIASENDGQVEISVKAKGNYIAPFSVRKTEKGTETAGQDPVEPQDIFRWTQQDLTTNNTPVITFQIPIRDDRIVEKTEYFNIELAVDNPIVKVVNGGQATVFIEDNDVLVSFATPRIRVREDSGEIMVRIEVTGDRDVPFNLCAETVFTTAPSVDSADSEDFLRFNGCSLTIFPDTKEIELPVTIIDDDIVEDQEIFAIVLSSDNPFVSFGGNQTAIVTILENDGLILEFASTQFGASESNEKVEISVKVKGNYTAPFSVRKTDSQNSVEPEDIFGWTQQDLTANDTPVYRPVIRFQIPIRDDRIVEGTEYFNIELAADNPIVKVGNRGQARIFILDNDSAGGQGGNSGSGLGETITLENGIILSELESSTELLGGTTRQASMSSDTPVLEIKGAPGTRYLRTGVGEVYENGYWLHLDESESAPSISYSSFGNLPRAIDNLALDENGYFANPSEPPGSSSDREIDIEYLFAPAFWHPVPQYLKEANVDGDYFTGSSTFRSDSRAEEVSVIGGVSEPSDRSLRRATAAAAPEFLQLPPDFPERIRDLAIEIVEGIDTDYERAKAIEQYVRTNYEYRFADDAGGIGPGGRTDPIEDFLFVQRAGTCGNFSSAMVVLARSVGLPARVVVGWAVSPDAESQTVGADQAHQWAEVAFEGIGWVEFEPTGSGAPDRVSGGLEEEQQNEDNDSADEQEGNSGSDLGETITLENGIVLSELEPSTELLGGTTRQAPMPSDTPVFEIEGAPGTRYLRTGVGEVYENGYWLHLDESESAPSISYTSFDNLPRFIDNLDLDENGYFANPSEPAGNSSDREIDIEYLFAPAFWHPVPQYLKEANVDGDYFTGSSTFRSDSRAEAVSVIGGVSEPSDRSLRRATAAAAPEFLQLPPDFPERIRDLAIEIVEGIDTDYERAKAIEQYVRTNYEYRFADDAGGIGPGGRTDPIEDFLFVQRAGTCGNFSSAMVALARSVGLPARVVVGWAVSPDAESQAVKADQAHQWAEVAFEGIGWVEFEPTGGGAPDRVSGGLGEEEQNEDTPEELPVTVTCTFTQGIIKCSATP